MIDYIKKLLGKNEKEKKKTYVADVPDWTAIAYWFLIFSLGVYYAVA